MSAVHANAVAAATPGPGRHQESDGRYRRWRSWRWVLLGLVVATQLAGVLSSAVRADAEDFFTDLEAGHVQAVEGGSFPSDPDVGYLLDPNDDSSDQYTSPAGVRWIGRWGALYQADLAGGPAGTSNGHLDPWQVDVAATAAVAARRSDHRIPGFTVDLRNPSAPLLPLAAGGAMFLVIWLLVAGPQPRRFTKWGWFWIIAVIPAGIGAIWYLLREAPWSPRASAIPPLPPRTTRAANHPAGPSRRGGFFALLVAALLFAPVAALLHAGLYTLTDHHGEPPATWRMVGTNGQIVVGHTDR